MLNKIFAFISSIIFTAILMVIMTLLGMLVTYVNAPVYLGILFVSEFALASTRLFGLLSGLMGGMAFYKFLTHKQSK